MSGTLEREPPPERSAPLIPFREIFSLDLRSLALLRVGLGVLLVLDWADRLPDLRAHYSDDGIVPRQAISGIVPISVQLFSGEVWFQALLAGVAFAAAGALVVGYRTALATFFSWLLLLGVHGRNVMVLQGGDMLLRLLLFWGLFLPLGACWSIDGADPRSRPKARSQLTPATVAYVVQLVLVYFFAAAWKWAPEWRDDGTAVNQALGVACFTTRFGLWLRDQTELCRWLTYSTLWLEGLGPAVLFLPFSVSRQRLLVIAAFLLFHTGLAVTLELGNFPWVCCVAWLALLPGSFWDRLAAQLAPPRLAEWTLWYDPRRPRARRWLALAQTFLFLERARFTAVEAATVGGPSGGVIDPQGRKYHGREALVLLGRLSPVVPLAPPTPPEGDPPVGGGASPLTTGPAGQEAAPAGSLSAAIVWLALAYVILWNIRSFDEDNRVVLPYQAQQLGWVLGLDQGWGLFAPRPGRLSGWYLFIGTRRDGVRVDLAGGGPVDESRPELISATFANGRWRKLITNLSLRDGSGRPSYPALLAGYPPYLYREWNRRHGAAERLRAVEIVYMQEVVAPPGLPTGPPEPELLVHYAPGDETP